VLMEMSIEGIARHSTVDRFSVNDLIQLSVRTTYIMKTRVQGHAQFVSSGMDYHFLMHSDRPYINNIAP